MMIIGLLLSIVFWSTFQSWIMMSIGILIQLVAFMYFMVNCHYMANQEQKLGYAIGSWLLTLPKYFFVELVMNYYPRPRMYFIDCGGIIILINRKKGTE